MWCSGTSSISPSRAANRGGAATGGSSRPPAAPSSRRTPEGFAGPTASSSSPNLCRPLVEFQPGHQVRTRSSSGDCGGCRPSSEWASARVRVERRAGLEDGAVRVQGRAPAPAQRLAGDLAAVPAPGGGRRGGARAAERRQLHLERGQHVVGRLPAARLAAPQAHEQLAQPAPGRAHVGPRRQDGEVPLRPALVAHPGAGLLGEGRRREHHVGAGRQPVLQRGQRDDGHVAAQQVVDEQRGGAAVQVVVEHDGDLRLAARERGQRLHQGAAAEHAQADAVRLRDGEHERAPGPRRRPACGRRD